MKLKYLLKEKGLKPKDIINSTGWSVRKVSDVLNGTHWPTEVETRKLAEIFRMTTEEIYIYLSK